MLKKVLVGVAVIVAAIIMFIAVARKTSSTVHVERTFNAPLSKVWALWTDPEAMKQWWSPKDFTAPVIESDFRVGGKFHYAMKSPQGEMFWNAGTYTEIIPQQKIVASFSFSDASGRLVPGPEVKLPGAWPDAVTVTVQFKEGAGKTQVIIEEEGIPLIMKFLATLGWEQQLDKFTALL